MDFDKRSAERIGRTVRAVERSHLENRNRQRRRVLFDDDSTVTGATGSSVFVKITSKVAYNHYLVSVYGDDPDNDPTATGETLKIPQIAASETVPNDTWLLATLLSSGTYWAQPSVWLNDPP